MSLSRAPLAERLYSPANKVSHITPPSGHRSSRKRTACLSVSISIATAGESPPDGSIVTHLLRKPERDAPRPYRLQSCRFPATQEPSSPGRRNPYRGQDEYRIRSNRDVAIDRLNVSTLHREHGTPRVQGALVGTAALRFNLRSSGNRQQTCLAGSAAPYGAWMRSTELQRHPRSL